jgi:hypothetical protein
MITAKVKNTRENVWDFIIFFTLFLNKRNKVMLLVYLLCFAVIILGGIITFAVMKEILILIITLLFVLVMFISIFVVFLLLKSSTYDFFMAGGGEQAEPLTVTLDKNVIIMKKGDTPVALYEWERVGDAFNAKTASYIFTSTGSEGSVLIISHDAITEGTREELIAIIEERNRARA